MPAGEAAALSLWWRRIRRLRHARRSVPNLSAAARRIWANQEPLPSTFARMYLAPIRSGELTALPFSVRAEDSASEREPLRYRTAKRPIGCPSWHPKPGAVVLGDARLRFRRAFSGRVAGVAARRDSPFADAGHYLLEDAGERAIERIEEFLNFGRDAKRVSAPIRYLCSSQIPRGPQPKQSRQTDGAARKNRPARKAGMIVDLPDDVRREDVAATMDDEDVDRQRVCARRRREVRPAPYWSGPRRER